MKLESFITSAPTDGGALGGAAEAASSLAGTFSSLMNAPKAGSEDTQMAQTPLLPVGPAGPPLLPGILDLPDVRGLMNGVKDRLRNAVLGQAERSLPSRVDEALGTLEDHDLKNSFLAHAKDQLERYGKIYVGVIDNFDRAESTHGEGVARRIKASMPEYLRPYVEVVPFDVSGGNTNEAYQNAIKAAQNKDIVALSVNGGLEPLNKEGLERKTGIDEIDPGNRQQAFWSGMANFKGKPDYEQFASNMMGISSISRTIPVVTPVWNDGNTTLPAIAGAGPGGPIVTSIEEKYGNTNRTEGPGMVDFQAPLPSVAAVRNTYTSQSAPYFIGQILGGISEKEMKEILKD